MQIDVQYDTSVSSMQSAEQNSFVSAINYVVGFYESIFTNPITVTIDVGFGEVRGTPVTGNVLGLTEPTLQNQSGALLGYSYSEIYNALTGDSIPASELTASDPSNGQVFTIAESDAKALGLNTNTGGVDAYVVFSSSQPFDYSLTNGAATGAYDFVSVVEHEFSHALGRTTHSVAGCQYMSILDMYRYVAAGVLAPYASTTSYFSLNRGAMDIENFGSELSSWNTFSAGYDAYSSQILADGQYNVTLQDLELMDALGYATPSDVIGAGTNFGGYGEQDKFLRATTGQLVNWQYNACGALVGGVAMTLNGAAALIDTATTIVGTGVGFLSYGLHDLFGRLGTGQLFAWEANSLGTIVSGANLTVQDAPLMIDTATSVVGADEDFFGNGGRTIFLRSAAGGLSALEFNASGALNATQTLTNNGSAVAIDTATTVVGGGEDFFGNGGRTVFVRDAAGGLIALAFNASGALNAAQTPTNNGSAVVIDAATTVVGAGEDFFGNGDHTIFLRSAAGGLVALASNANGALTAAQTLTNNGAAVTIDAATTVIGGGEDFFGNGGHTVFVRNAAGGLIALEANADGSLTAAQTLMSNGNPVTIDTATTAIGAARNFAGTGGDDVFLLTGSGNLEYLELNGSGAATTNMTFAYASNDAAVCVGARTSVVGAAYGVLGQNERDVFLRDGGEQLHVWDVVNNSMLQMDLGLTFGDGSLATISAGDTVSGGGQNVLGRGGHDIMVQAATGQTHVWEFNANGIVLAMT